MIQGTSVLSKVPSVNGYLLAQLVASHPKESTFRAPPGALGACSAPGRSRFRSRRGDSRKSAAAPRGCSVNGTPPSGDGGGASLSDPTNRGAGGVVSAPLVPPREGGVVATPTGGGHWLNGRQRRGCQAAHGELPSSAARSSPRAPRGRGRRAGGGAGPRGGGGAEVPGAGPGGAGRGARGAPSSLPGRKPFPEPLDGGEPEPLGSDKQS
ncbi:hypothetical protein VULLAG_LOCUS6343 [Vulpes lagopus]